MEKEDAIKFLQQLYPNGGHCWLDEQRIEAISMAINALRGKTILSNIERNGKDWKEEPVSEDLELAATKYAQDKYMPVQTSQAFKAGAQWQASQGITREAVIGMATEEIALDVSEHTLDALDLYPGDKVIIQIRKKED